MYKEESARVTRWRDGEWQLEGASACERVEVVVSVGGGSGW